MAGINLDYLAINDTKLDKKFPNEPFDLREFEMRAKRDRDKDEGGQCEFVKRTLFPED